MNGFKAEAKQLRSWSEVEDWLRREILRCYPDSEFAKEAGQSGASFSCRANAVIGAL